MTEAVGAAAGLAATDSAMQGIISAANSGQFQITPEAGDELIRTFEELAEQLRNMWRDMADLKRKTPLGDSPAGTAISEFNQQVAAGGDGRSYEEMLRQIRERVPLVIESIRRGIQLYQEVDEGNANFGVQV
ncbi:hypothetical protein A8924_1377 [Saccharopolyspora erythraea NRRL 2338]|uniref:Uncharacterized protein n=2 Tax=Saccharopolyspora erythraea TaxID=1836 RepID=A4F8E1_SACEN|nr:hypothetical protein [Saccharopolyspora erythraea]EQD82269.1 hypothetical protein N599_31570 [Saccharopolyspora erythraea D]PFG94111.1 hypothetical protein A8924_1377 [Saccharopolyspora erythraea NRRL 2338]QRK90901.1 hypothetical protein JQX30_05430 [Saccharopolyspora erythraea]CAM00316.1 hypothetical protein SACE_0984 [Saccharopolyspora erythraea NRRL 2338]